MLIIGAEEVADSILSVGKVVVAGVVGMLMHKCMYLTLFFPDVITMKS